MTPLQGTPGAIWALARSGFAGVVRNVFFWIAVGYAGLVVAIAVTWVSVPLALLAQGDEGARRIILDIIITPTWLMGLIGWLANVAVVIIVAIVGTRTLSRDRMLGGLEFILSKSIPPWGYVLGRVTTPVGAAVVLLTVPMLLIVLLLEALVDDLPSAARDLLWSSVVAALVTAVLLGVLGAGLGSLVAQPRKAVVLWLLVVWATLPLSLIAQEGFEADWWWALGPLPLARATTQTLLNRPFPSTAEWAGWVTILVLVVASLSVIRWRVREVVR